MPYKAMLLALLMLSVSGCAVYGGSGYAHRVYYQDGYDQRHTNPYYRQPPHRVYAIPPQRYYTPQYDIQHPAPHRYAPRYSITIEPSRQYRGHADYRRIEPHSWWNQSRRDIHRERHWQRSHGHGGWQENHSRRDDRRGWERQRQ
jgi:hypothetical protein